MDEDSLCTGRCDCYFGSLRMISMLDTIRCSYLQPFSHIPLTGNYAYTLLQFILFFFLNLSLVLPQHYWYSCIHLLVLYDVGYRKQFFPFLVVLPVLWICLWIVRSETLSTSSVILSIFLLN